MSIFFITVRLNAVKHNFLPCFSSCRSNTYIDQTRSDANISDDLSDDVTGSSASTVDDEKQDDDEQIQNLFVDDVHNNEDDGTSLNANQEPDVRLFTVFSIYKLFDI